MAVTATGGAQLDPATYQQRFDERVGELVAAAYGRSAGFRARLAEHGLSAAELSDVAALDQLPVLTKDELLAQQRAAPPFGGLLADDAHVRRVFQSPGPLYEPELGGGDGWRWAPALAAAGFSSDDVVLIAFGFHLSPAGAMFEAACVELGATVLPAGVGSKDLQVRACSDLAVSAYIGPPSYLKALLDAADEAGEEPAIGRAFVTAEPLPPSLRSLLEARVPVVRQGYGTAEAGHLGSECEAREGMHVPDDALVQICDLTTGAARDDEADGQVVVTLFATDYPVVRFGTGDLSSWLHEPCSCGSPTPRIRGWAGRVGDAVKVRGMFLHPRQVAQTMAGVDGVARYRVVVDRVEHRDELRCEVVADGDAAEVAARVTEHFREGLRFNVEVAVVEALPDDTPLLDDRRDWS
jgi:phenylacetate-CoA ligase